MTIVRLALLLVLGVAPLAADSTLPPLAPRQPDTPLVEAGRPTAVIVLAGDAFRAAAEALQQAVRRQTGVELPITEAERVPTADLAKTAVIALGRLEDNPWLFRLVPNAAYGFATPPAGQYRVQTLDRPLGLGRNGVVVLARDEAGADAAVAGLCGRLRAGVLPWTSLPESEAAPDAWRREVMARSAQLDARTPDSDRRLAEALPRLLCGWVTLADAPALTAADQRATEAALYRLTLATEAAYGRAMLALQTDLPTEQLLARVRRQEPRLRGGAQTAPAYALFTAAQVFGARGLPAAAWDELARLTFEPMREASRPAEDAWGVMDAPMRDTLWYFAAREDRAYLASGRQEAYLRLRRTAVDNTGSPVRFGGDGAFEPGAGPAAAVQQPDYLAAWASIPWKPDPAKLDPKDTLGLDVVPVEQPFGELHGAPGGVPLFDKLVGRTAFDPARQYLLVNGLGVGEGRSGANALLRFADRGRCWLIDAGAGPTNGLSFTRDGTAGPPPRFARLDGYCDGPAVGLTQTVLAGWHGATWRRSLAWLKDRYAVVFDRLEAATGGDYELAVNWQSLGRVRIDVATATVAQEGGPVLRLTGADGARLTATDDAEAGRRWARYPYAEPIVRRLAHRAGRHLEPGDAYTFHTMFYTQGSDEASRYELRRVDDRNVLVTGQDLALVALGPVLDGQLDAQLSYVSPDHVVAVGCRAVRLGPVGLQLGQPTDFSLDLDTGDLRLGGRAASLGTVPEAARKKLAEVIRQRLQTLAADTPP